MAKYAKFLGILHLEGQIESLNKSSEKDLGGFAPAFLRAPHRPIQNDWAVLAPEAISAKGAGWMFRYTRR